MPRAAGRRRRWRADVLVQLESMNQMKEHIRSQRFRRLLPYIEMSVQPPEFDMYSLERIGEIESLIAVLGSESTIAGPRWILTSNLTSCITNLIEGDCHDWPEKIVFPIPTRFLKTPPLLPPVASQRWVRDWLRLRRRNRVRSP